MSKRTTRSLLIAAGVILLAALIWLVLLENGSSVRAVCERINEHGYRLSPADLYLRGYGSGTSIRALLENEGVGEEELQNLITLSQSRGFGGDIDKSGKVELLMWNENSERVMLIYTVDGDAELVFMEQVRTGEVGPID